MTVPTTADQENKGVTLTFVAPLAGLAKVVAKGVPVIKVAVDTAVTVRLSVAVK